MVSPLASYESLVPNPESRIPSPQPLAAVMSYKLTYSTMFDPPAEMHTRFEAALKDVRSRLGEKHALHINGPRQTQSSRSRMVAGIVRPGGGGRGGSRDAGRTRRIRRLACDAAATAHSVVASRRAVDRRARLSHRGRAHA